jgi:hypothetical protein
MRRISSFIKSLRRRLDFIFSIFTTLLSPFVTPQMAVSRLLIVVLLNILIALFNQAYSVVTDNAVDEFLAVFSNKTLEYIRAPDENPFTPPLNLIEIFFLIPLQPFLSMDGYQRINKIVMFGIYAPFLTIIALYESKYPPNLRLSPF